MSHFVYRCFDDADTVIYVGCTGNPERRKGDHRRLSAWWPTVARIESTEYDSRAEALAVERSEILTYQPAHNTMYLETVGAAGIFPIDQTCRIGNCSAHGGMDRLCEPHRLEKQRRSNGDDCSDGRGPWKLTDEQVTDIRRRMTRFENPKDIARLHGITKSMLFRVMKRTAAAS